LPILIELLLILLDLLLDIERGRRGTCAARARRRELLSRFQLVRQGVALAQGDVQVLLQLRQGLLRRLHAAEVIALLTRDEADVVLLEIRKLLLGGGEAPFVVADL